MHIGGRDKSGSRGWRGGSLQATAYSKCKGANFHEVFSDAIQTDAIIAAKAGQGRCRVLEEILEMRDIMPGRLTLVVVRSKGNFAARLCTSPRSGINIASSVRELPGQHN
ncbi:hypothetical protein ONS96_005224 [Cadophora gregata f. sp. sojae]|nr:hypothetical protein ONS96_005224 [Cadophora gregata f. sp. sojae]